MYKIVMYLYCHSIEFSLLINIRIIIEKVALLSIYYKQGSNLLIDVKKSSSCIVKKSLSILEKIAYKNKAYNNVQL